MLTGILALTFMLGLPPTASESQTELELWTANDGFAGVRDWRARQDEGATASLGFAYATEGHRVAVGYYLFTEPLGPLRTDWLRIAYTQTVEWPGRLGFDRIEGVGGFGLQLTGDLGGAQLQDFWHRVTPTERDLTFRTGLQREYSANNGLAFCGIAALRGRKRMGWLEWTAQLSADLPVGNTGLLRLAASGSLLVGQEYGLFGALGLELAEQQGLGEAFDFAGAPVDGWVGIPRVVVGFRRSHWGILARWENNHLGTSQGLGGSIFTESIIFRLRRRW